MLAVTAVPSGQVQFLVLTDDGESLGWFDSDAFMTVDPAIHPSWVARVREGGDLELGPDEWLADGFWESYYEGNQAAVEVVKRRLVEIRRDSIR